MSTAKWQNIAGSKNLFKPRLISGQTNQPNYLAISGLDASNLLLCSSKKWPKK